MEKIIATSYLISLMEKIVSTFLLGTFRNLSLLEMIFRRL
jgi:hypothetical protein